MYRNTLLVAGLIFGAASAQAGITAFNFVDVDNSAGSPTLDAYSTTDILIDFDSRWTGSQMLILLEQGSIYQNTGVAGNGPPSLALQASDPSATYDSYVTLNATSADELQANLLTFGGAIDLGGSPTITFSENGIDAAWSYLPSPPPVDDSFWANYQDQTDFLVSRVSLSNDAKGTFTVLASAGGLISTTSGSLDSLSGISSLLADLQVAQDSTDPNAPLLVQGTIQNGAFVIPEPTTAALLGLGLLGVARRRSA